MEFSFTIHNSSKEFLNELDKSFLESWNATQFAFPYGEDIFLLASLGHPIAKDLIGVALGFLKMPLFSPLAVIVNKGSSSSSSLLVFTTLLGKVSLSKTDVLIAGTSS